MNGNPFHRCVLLVDNTNLFIGGQQLSAQRKGIRRKRRHDVPSDPSWRLDFEGLRDCLAAGREVYAALMVGSSPAGCETVWEESAEAAGFTVVVHDMNRRREEKAVDTELVARGVEIICSAQEPMALVLASGDRDYVPLVELAQRHGWLVEMAAFQSSFPPEGEMAKMVNRVRPLDECLEQVGRCEYAWPEAA